MIHTNVTADGRKIRYNDLTKHTSAYIRRGNLWQRASMKDAINKILLAELLEQIKKPKIEGLVRNIKERCSDGLGKEES